MDFKRILTALCGLPVVVLVLALGNTYVVDILLMIVAIICMHEYLSVIKKVSHPLEWIAYASTVVIVIASFVTEDLIMKIVMYGLPFLILLLFSKVIITEMKTTFKDVAYTSMVNRHMCIFNWKKFW